MQTPFDLGVAFLEIFVASIMLLVFLTVTGQFERLLQTQAVLAQQIETQRETTDLRRFHRANIPYYEALGAIHTHARYDFPIIFASETELSNFTSSHVDIFIIEAERLAITNSSNYLFFKTSTAITSELNDIIRNLSPSTRRFDSWVLRDDSGVPLAILFTF